MYVLVDGVQVPVEDVQVVAALVGSVAPRPVRVTVTGIPYGAVATISAVTSEGERRVIPGGVVTSTGSHVSIRRIDNRWAPLNTPVRYEVALGGEVFTSNEVTVTYPGKYLIQSYDGRTSVDFSWQSNGLPRTPVLRSVSFDVPGRRRPPVHFAPGGDGGGELVIRTDAANGARLGEVLVSGRPLVVRTDGDVRDFPAVELVQPLSAPNRLIDTVAPGGRSLSSDREWTIPYLLVDDPEPSTAVTAFTWGDVDAALGGRDWPEVESMFTPIMWDEFEQTDWAQYA